MAESDPDRAPALSSRTRGFVERAEGIPPIAASELHLLAVTARTKGDQ